MKLIIFETESIVEAYSGLDQLTRLGHIPLEFSPNSHGARVLFKAAEGADLPTDIKLQICTVSDQVTRAYLSLSDAKLAEMLVILESKSLVDVLQMAQALEDHGARILEVRSFKSNPHINYLIATYDSPLEVSSLVEKMKHIIIKSDGPGIRDFLGFNI